MSSPIALIIGAGPGVGAGVIKAFAAKGYRVASAARSLKDETTSDGQLKIKVDLSSPGNVKPLFEKVKEKLGAPSVVVYNGESPAAVVLNVACAVPHVRLAKANA
jgi:NAD(P)-dependent dehydrogenase (short-subunit alcohol dehydrogenase family)